MVMSDYQLIIEENVTNGLGYYDNLQNRFLRHCTGFNLEITENMGLETALALMEMVTNKMPVEDRLKWVLKNRQQRFDETVDDETVKNGRRYY